MSSEAPEFLAGIIEGFYGRQWSFDSRLAYAGYLAELGLNTYIYCPKADPYLRKQWHLRWPEAFARPLRQLSSAYQKKGLTWGVGLSPFALYQDYSEKQRERLRRKVDEILSLQPSALAILFDDMPGDLLELASRQAGIVADVCEWVGHTRVLVCPTYYSFDPVLEKHFGAMPAQYWPRLGRELPEAVDVFWTGNKVCSDEICAHDIERITQSLGRPVMLWDNYPVNDGAMRSRHLYCQPLAERSPELGKLLTGHLCNPMNQAMLSLPGITGLAALHGVAHDEQWLGQVLGAELWAQLRTDRDLFQQEGLDGLDDKTLPSLAARYSGLPGQAAMEVAAWLRGEYTFDPACLTE